MSENLGLYTASEQDNLERRQLRLNSPTMIHALGDHNYLRGCLADLEKEGYKIAFSFDSDLDRYLYVAEKEGQMIQVIP